jgi:hypothetical protein
MAEEEQPQKKAQDESAAAGGNDREEDTHRARLRKCAVQEDDSSNFENKSCSETESR